MTSPTWEDVKPGDTVIEHDGHKAVYVIAKLNEDITSSRHWDVVVLTSTHPNTDRLTAYRKHWIRCSAPPGDRRKGREPVGIPIPPNHEVVRGGETVYRT